jgi:hypothetical protein
MQSRPRTVVERRLVVLKRFDCLLHPTKWTCEQRDACPPPLPIVAGGGASRFDPFYCRVAAHEDDRSGARTSLHLHPIQQQLARAPRSHMCRSSVRSGRVGRTTSLTSTLPLPPHDLSGCCGCRLLVLAPVVTTTPSHLWRPAPPRPPPVGRVHVPVRAEEHHMVN